MKEHLLIKNLTEDLKPFRPADTLGTYFLKWSGFTTIILLLSWWILPLRGDWSVKLSQPVFHLENLLWLGLTFSSAISFFYSTFPEGKPTPLRRTNYVLLTALFGLVLLRFTPATLGNDIHYEMDLWVGRCGFIIMIVGILHAAMLTTWAAKTAPRSGAMSGFWAALSASALGCFLMQLVCFHNSSVHLMLWHFLPLTLLCLVSSAIGRRWLKW
jgi:hypothetical protein